MINVRRACDHLYGKLLFTWLSLVMSLMVSFCAVPFLTRCLDEILDLIESVSVGVSHLLMSCEIHRRSLWRGGGGLAGCKPSRSLNHPPHTHTHTHTHTLFENL